MSKKEARSKNRRRVTDAFSGEEYAADRPDVYQYPPPPRHAEARPSATPQRAEGGAVRKKDRRTEFVIRVSVLADHGATAARAAYFADSISIMSATGSAKREPGDAYDPETGRLLATARALQSLAGKLHRQANGRVRHAEEIKRHRERARVMRLADAVSSELGASERAAGGNGTGEYAPRHARKQGRS